MKNEKLIKANKHIKKGAKLWEDANNSGNSSIYNDLIKASDKNYSIAEGLIKEVYPDIKIDYPGLYPSFNLGGFEFYTLESLEFHNEVTK